MHYYLNIFLDLLDNAQLNIDAEAKAWDQEDLEGTQTLKMWKVGYPKFGLSDFYHSQVIFNSDF